MPFVERIKSRLRRYRVYGALRHVYLLASRGGYRRGLALARQRPDNLFQPFGNTRADRYPVIFRFVAARLGDRPAPRILSFGCSTGEEVFTLRRHLPAAFIKGIDIDARAIATCRRRLDRRDAANTEFAVASSAAGEATASYDAIFCMAVLRHAGLDEASVGRCDEFIRFADFESVAGEFVRCLKPGGLLVLRHSNFRFRDSALAEGFATVLRVPPLPRTALFGPDNRRLVGAHDDEVVFEKRRDHS